MEQSKKIRCKCGRQIAFSLEGELINVNASVRNFRRPIRVYVSEGYIVCPGCHQVHGIEKGQFKNNLLLSQGPSNMMRVI